MTKKTKEMPDTWQEQLQEELQGDLQGELQKPSQEPLHGQPVDTKKRKKRKKKRYLLKFFLCLLVIGAVIFVISLSYFDIKTITVTGNDTISHEQAISDAGVKEGDNIFFLNKRKISKNMHKKSALYGDIKIDRQFPNEIVIDIAERIPAMTLPYGDKYVVLDDEGVVLGLSTTVPKVTEIGGITIKKMDSGEVVEINEEATFEKAKTIIKKTEKADIFFMSVSIDGDDVVCNVYDKLYVKCTYDELTKIMEDGSLKEILYDLYSKGIKRGTVKVDSDKYCSFTPTY